MSEEEIIEQFEHWIEYEKQHKDKINKAEELIAIQQGLLDLYNKEKEKNKELYEIKYIASRFINRSMKQFSIGEFKYKVNKFIEWEDKIKEKIEWYEKTCEHLSKNGSDLDKYDQYQGAIEALKELGWIE